jgi:Flp pilus assembly pilin Flp
MCELVLCECHVTLKYVWEIEREKGNWTKICESNSLVRFLDDGRCATTVAHAKLIMFGSLGTVATVATCAKLIMPMHGIRLMDLLCANVQ